MMRIARMFDFSHDVSQSSDHRCHLNDVSVWVCTFFPFFFLCVISISLSRATFQRERCLYLKLLCVLTLFIPSHCVRTHFFIAQWGSIFFSLLLLFHHYSIFLFRSSYFFFLGAFISTLFIHQVCVFLWSHINISIYIDGDCVEILSGTIEALVTLFLLLIVLPSRAKPCQALSHPFKTDLYINSSNTLLL